MLSYQIEGAVLPVNEYGQGPSMWDIFCSQLGATTGAADGSTACNHYHRVDEDVTLMASLNIWAYRFPISYPMEPSPAGSTLDFYNHLINMLMDHDIEPWVILFHWDLPQALEEEYGGWLSANTSQAFADYAALCFELFGDCVRQWITLNEAWTVTVNGYGTGWSPFRSRHNLLHGHALAVGKSCPETRHLWHHPAWRINDMAWPSSPDVLLWISERHDYPLIYITEKGTAEKDKPMKPTLQQPKKPPAYMQ